MRELEVARCSRIARTPVISSVTGLEGLDGQAVSADVDAGTGRELVPVEEPVAHGSTGSADRALQCDIITDGNLLA